MHDSNDIDLEQQLWKNPLPVTKKILDVMAAGDCISEKNRTKKLFVGKWNGGWCLCDNDNIYNCTKAIKAVVPLEDSVYKGFMFNMSKSFMSKSIAVSCTRVKFKPLDDEDPRYAKLVLERIFRHGASLEVLKSRWIARKPVVKDCWSLQSACCALGIDPWALAVENDLDASSC